MTVSASSAPQAPLSATRCTALYVGALLGPSLLLLPGLAAAIAGPASIVAWLGLLAVSALLARVFTALGTRITGGVAEYTAAGLGRSAGKAIGHCFTVGVVLGAPVVSLIGGNYVARLLGLGHLGSVLAAAVLLTLVVLLTLGGARAGTTVQLGLVAVLVGLVTVAVVGSAPHARAANWLPFAPHGWSAIGTASSVLMLSFVGWEAIAPLTGRLRSPARQLPKVIAAAFAVTALVYLGVAAATVAVLGGRAGSSVPLADLLRVAVGSVGPVIATAAAVALTLAACNAYISGAAARVRRPESLRWGIVAAGVLVLGGAASGVVDTAGLVAVPTTLFLTVYLGCTVSAARVLGGSARVAAALSCVAVAVVLAFCGWALVIPVLVCAAGWRGRCASGRNAGLGVSKRRTREGNRRESCAQAG